MRASQKTLFIFTILAALCVLAVAIVDAAPAAPNGAIIISKTVSPQLIEPDYTGVLTYTITVTNTASPGVLNAYMEDTLPTLLSFGELVEKPTIGTTEVTGETISWTGRLPAPSEVNPSVVTFVFTAELPGPESIGLLLAENQIVNTARAGHIDGTFIIEDSDTAITRICRHIYLPLVMSDFMQ
jgi:uncharacterized repeat protein (TIGR01451 family)